MLKEHGTAWSLISRNMPGRSPYMLKAYLRHKSNIDGKDYFELYRKKGVNVTLDFQCELCEKAYAKLSGL